MKVTVLGTGTSQGVPIIGCTCDTCLSSDPRDKRLRSSIFLETENNKILIDIGPDFRTQFLDNQLTTLDAILITHEHNDHVIGVDDVRAINFTQKKSIPIYAESRVCAEIKERFKYAFSEHPIPGLPQISLHNISEKPFQLNGDLIEPIRIMHGQLPILGFRLKDFAYITDANFIPKGEISKLKGIKYLIINALRKESHYSHFTLEEALEQIQIINPKQAYLTHISHVMGLTEQWTQNLPSNVMALEDKMTINVL